ncbi:hypothetical protein FS837_002774 [Tulasnella sp. UAMH 9824]|nr:hypothetical protein FS837_002774 [Tulasnella sp. UAMH 9824]
METPAAATIQPNSEIRSDITPQPSPAITWVTFSGSPGESSGDFIQAIQRVAFQQGHSRDDRWIADYIATCFNGGALQWYSELDEETQESWRRLRTALLRRYPPAGPNSAPRTEPTRTPAVRGGSSTSSRNASTRSGLIEVLSERTTSFGYLCLDSESSVGITNTRANAVVVNLPSQLPSEPIQLSLDGVPGNARTDFRNLGLGLLASRGADPDQIPKEVMIVKQIDEDVYFSGAYEDPAEYEYESGIPKPSALCKGKSTYADGSVIATWVLVCCGDSRPSAFYRRRSSTRVPSQRAAAAVWKYENSGELRLWWLMDNDRESELEAYIQRRSSNLSLHVHRASDMREASRFFEEERVRFIFHPTQ